MICDVCRVFLLKKLFRCVVTRETTSLVDNGSPGGCSIKHPLEEITFLVFVHRHLLSCAHALKGHVLERGIHPLEAAKGCMVELTIQLFLTIGSN